MSNEYATAPAGPSEEAENSTSHIFHRDTGQRYPVAATGSGVYITDTEGRKYLDASSGAAVSCLGHGHPAIVAAIKAQLDRLEYAHTSFFTSEPAEALADLLTGLAPGELDRVFIVSGGSEANEAAIKLARQYFLETGQPGRHRIISRRQSYHGATLGTLAIRGNEWNRAPFEKWLMDVSHIPPCYAYRGREAGESEFDYGQRVANELEQEVLRLGPDTVMAFFAEPVVGASLGAVAGVPGYFRRIREICDEYGVLLILDEVMCGMGRTGTLYACEQDGVAPDIVTLAKGLGAGYQPVGAMLCTRAIHDALHHGSQVFEHGHTALGHPLACAASLAVVPLIQNLLPRVRATGAALMNAMESRFGGREYVGDIRGRGLLVGLELVADRDSKQPFDPKLQLHNRIKQTALANGLLCYPRGGTVDGRSGDHVLLAPPFVLEESHIEELVTKLDETLTAEIRNLTLRVPVLRRQPPAKDRRRRRRTRPTQPRRLRIEAGGIATGTSRGIGSGRQRTLAVPAAGGAVRRPPELDRPRRQGERVGGLVDIAMAGETGCEIGVALLAVDDPQDASPSE